MSFFDDLNLVLIIILILHSRALRSCVKSGISSSERAQFDSEKREREKGRKGGNFTSLE